MFENPRRGRQARNFTTNVPKILVLKSSSEQIFSRKLPLGAPVTSLDRNKRFPLLHYKEKRQWSDEMVFRGHRSYDFRGAVE